MDQGPYRIAIAQYQPDFLTGWDAYAAKIEGWVREAAEAGAALLVFPEYAAMELTSLQEEALRADLNASIDALQIYWDDFDRLHENLARQYKVHIVAGSFPKDRCNVAPFYGPDGKIGEQYKAIMTRFEREEWVITPQQGQQVFETALGRIGIAICLDSEFPLQVRRLAEAGAEIILVPSCTDTLAGYHRVRIGCQARALENQCYVAQSPLVGAAAWSPAIDVNIGAAALYGPPDIGFPDDGVIAMGEMNKPGWVYADVNPARVHSVRRHGRVQNFKYWDEQ